MWHLNVDGRRHDRPPLSHLLLHPFLGGSGDRKYSGDTMHRRGQGGVVVERADDDLDAALGQASNAR
jgi:hypothetical protein